MGQRGPAKKPTALRVLEGDRSHRPPNTQEPKPQVLADVPEPPVSLLEDPIGLELWNRLAPEVHKMGLLTVVDVEVLECYCLANSTRRAVPPGSAKWHQAVTQMLSISKRFGFTPADRASIKGPELDDQDARAGLTPSRVRRAQAAAERPTLVRR